MKAFEVEKLMELRNKKTISITDLPPVKDFIDVHAYFGTLLCGYNTNGDSVHIYATDGVIHAVTYNNQKEIVNHVAGEEVDFAECVPSKCVYPTRTQYFFAKRLIELGAEFCFADVNENEMGAVFGEFYPDALIVE